jgi:hypothetical protein
VEAVVVAYFAAIFWHFAGGNEEDHEKFYSGQLVS